MTPKREEIEVKAKLNQELEKKRVKKVIKEPTPEVSEQEEESSESLEETPMLPEKKGYRVVITRDGGQKYIKIEEEIKVEPVKEKRPVGKPKKIEPVKLEEVPKEEQPIPKEKPTRERVEYRYTNDNKDPSKRPVPREGMEVVWSDKMQKWRNRKIKDANAPKKVFEAPMIKHMNELKNEVKTNRDEMLEIKNMMNQFGEKFATQTKDIVRATSAKQMIDDLVTVGNVSKTNFQRAVAMNPRLAAFGFK